eukprot:scaffold9941_cov116-Isochrysis_galbana.AAC.8
MEQQEQEDMEAARLGPAHRVYGVVGRRLSPTPTASLFGFEDTMNMVARRQEGSEAHSHVAASE